MTLNEYLKQQLYPLELNINFIITDAKTHKEIFSTNEYLNKYASIPENLFDKTINNVKMKLKACRNIIFAQQPSGCGMPISVLIMNKLFTVSNDPNNETDIYTLITINKDDTTKEHTYNTINELVINNPNIIVAGPTITTSVKSICQIELDM